MEMEMIYSSFPSERPFLHWTWSFPNNNGSSSIIKGNIKGNNNNTNYNVNDNGGTILKGMPNIDKNFGQSVAISGDGQTLVVGSPDALGSGVVRIYELEEKDASSGGDDNDNGDEDGEKNWILTESLLGRQQGDKFGTAVALSQDGRVMAVGEPGRDGIPPGDKAGNVRTYVYSPFGYVSRGPNLEGTGATDHFGLSLALSKDGTRLAIGAPYRDNSFQSTSISGSKQRSYKRIGSNGGSNGNDNDSIYTTRLVSGTVSVYEWSIQAREWVPLGLPLAGTSHMDRFGWSLDLNHDGSLLCVGSPRNLEFGGHVRCFQEEKSYFPSDPNLVDTMFSVQWKPVGDVIRNVVEPVRYDDNFGASVKVSTDSSGTRHRVAIGAPGKNALASEVIDRGQVSVYEFNPEAAERGWIQLGREVLTPWSEVDSTNDDGKNFQMGFSLDFHQDLLAVGIPGANEKTGMVEFYEFERDIWRWVRNPSLFKGSGSTPNYYGAAVSMTPNGDFVVGSPQSEDDVGSVHIYRRDR